MRSGRSNATSRWTPWKQWKNQTHNFRDIDGGSRSVVEGFIADPRGPVEKEQSLGDEEAVGHPLPVPAKERVPGQPRHEFSAYIGTLLASLPVPVLTASTMPQTRSTPTPFVRAAAPIVLDAQSIHSKQRIR